jgi:hypothetical protein
MRFVLKAALCSIVAVGTLLLGGCASIEPTLKADAQPSADAAYIAGSFTRQNSGGFAFAITNLDTQREYGMSLGQDTVLPKDVSDDVVVMKVPPGRYQVTSWYTYGTVNKAKNGTFPIRNPVLSQPFEVPAQSVRFLGKFVARSDHAYGMGALSASWSIEPVPITEAQAREALSRSYSAFGNLDVKCQLCSD